MGSFEEKLCKFILSLLILAMLVSAIPVLSNYIGLNALIGYGLGVFYVRDRYGRYHYVFDGRYVSSEETCCLNLLGILFGIGIPAVITIWGLPYFALHELVIATFGAEIIAIFGGIGNFS